MIDVSKVTLGLRMIDLKKAARGLRRTSVRSRRRAREIDELGGSEDGSLSIIATGGETVHVTPPRVAAALRYLLARGHGTGGPQLPGRLAITSSLHGEGVTYISRSLASVIAYDTEASVAVVDLNWRRPASEVPRPGRRRRAKSVPSEQPTLADAVENDVPVDRIIIPTTNPRLSLVAAGIVPLARRPGIAGSRGLESAILDIADRFDHVILELPPVLASSDAIKLVALGEAFVFVVLHGVTSEGQIDAALGELRGAESLGIVLNRFESKVPRVLRRMVES